MVIGMRGWFKEFLKNKNFWTWKSVEFSASDFDLGKEKEGSIEKNKCFIFMWIRKGRHFWTLYPSQLQIFRGHYYSGIVEILKLTYAVLKLLDVPSEIHVELLEFLDFALFAHTCLLQRIEIFPCFLQLPTLLRIGLVQFGLIKFLE